MKDYDHVVVWLDYFNQTIKRSKGRRMGREKCVTDPSLNELSDAAAAAGFKIVESEDAARFPRRPYVRSGYVVIPKVSAKTKILARISEKMVAKRLRQQKRK